MSKNMPSALSIEQLSLAYGAQPILSNINLHLAEGKWLGLLGESGIGKTSLLRAIAGLNHPHEKLYGTIHVSPFSYMAQTDLLLPWLTVLDNVLIGYQLRGSTRKEGSALRSKAKALLQEVGLGHACHLLPQQLSGGMRQRVALVRTLLEERPVVLMDEPFSALDAITRYKLQALARALLQDKTVLFVTHDPIEALRLADEIYLLHGYPAQLKKVATLHTPAPREPSSPEIVHLETELFHELSAAAGER